ncbi:MAG: AI-2E family transporter [Vicinamibacterales bacterium]
MQTLVMPLRLIAGAVVIAFIYLGRPVLIPIVLAVFLFYALDPIVDWLQRFRVPRALGAVTVVVLVLGGALTGAVALWPQVEAVVTRIPEGARQLRATLRDARSGTSLATALKKVQDAATAIDQAAAESATPPVTTRGTLRVEVTEPWRVSDVLWSGGVSMIGVMGQAVSVLFLAIFLLIEDDSFKRKLVRRMETLGSKRVTVQILNDVASQIERFIWVQAVTSAGVAAVTFGALWWLDVDQPAAWGTFAGIMNLVPFFGPLIVTVVIAAVAFLQFGTLGPALVAAGVTLAITTIEGNFVTPHMLSRVASLNLVALFIAIAFWSWVWGVAGMLLAVPILMTAKVICDRVEGLEAVSEFLGA